MTQKQKQEEAKARKEANARLSAEAKKISTMELIEKLIADAPKRDSNAAGNINGKALKNAGATLGIIAHKGLTTPETLAELAANPWLKPAMGPTIEAWLTGNYRTEDKPETMRETIARQARELAELKAKLQS